MFVGNDFFRTDPMAGAVGNVFWEFFSARSTALLGLYRRASQGEAFCVIPHSLLLTMKHGYRCCTNSEQSSKRPQFLLPIMVAHALSPPGHFLCSEEFCCYTQFYSITNGDKGQQQRGFLKNSGGFSPYCHIHDVSHHGCTPALFVWCLSNAINVNCQC